MINVRHRDSLFISAVLTLRSDIGHSVKSSRRIPQQVQTRIENIEFTDIRDGLVDGYFVRRPFLGHHHNRCMLIWASWLAAGKFADRHDQFFSKREGLTGPELDRRGPIGKADTRSNRPRSSCDFPPFASTSSARNTGSKELFYRLNRRALQMPAFGSNVRRSGDRSPSASPRRASWFPVPPLRGWQSSHPPPRRRRSTSRSGKTAMTLRPICTNTV